MLGAGKAWAVGVAPFWRGDRGQDAARGGAGDRRAPFRSARERRLSGASEPASAARAAPLGPRRFRPLRAADHPLERQRPLRPSQQRRLLRVLRRGGERDPDRGGAARSRVEPGHRNRRRKPLPLLFRPCRFPIRSRSASRSSISAARRCAIVWRRSRRARRRRARKGDYTHVYVERATGRPTRDSGGAPAADGDADAGLSARRRAGAAHAIFTRER